MSFDWGHYLALAEWLRDNASTIATRPEAVYRTIVSRAYYAAHHRARAYLLDKYDFAPNADRVHEGVIRELNGRGGQDRNLARSLDRLRELRVQADYWLSKPLTKQNSEFAILIAQRAIDEMARSAQR